MTFSDYIHKFLSQTQTANQSFLARGCMTSIDAYPVGSEPVYDLRSIICAKKSIALKVERPLALKAERPLAPTAGVLSLLSWRPGSESLCP